MKPSELREEQERIRVGFPDRPGTIVDFEIDYSMCRIYIRTQDVNAPIVLQFGTISCGELIPDPTFTPEMADAMAAQLIENGGIVR